MVETRTVIFNPFLYIKHKHSKREEDEEEMSSTAEYLKHRADVFDRLWAAHETQLAAAKAAAVPITITLPSDSAASVTKQGIKDVTTPMDIAREINKKLVGESMVAKLTFSSSSSDSTSESKTTTLWDMFRPLEQSCQLEFLPYDSEEGHEVFWHSASHILGAALESVFPAMMLNRGPALEDGFFYEGAIPNAISPDDYTRIESAAMAIVESKPNFQRLVVAKQDAIDMFAGNPYKQHILTTKVADGGTCTVYRIGNFIDPCRGPHIAFASLIKAFKVTKNSSAYWLNDASKDSLQRVYGVAFPTAKMLKEWVTFQEEAAKRDHRRLGAQQELFFFHPLSPGSAFWLPHGARIYETLQTYLRREYRVRGYDIVVTPNVYNVELWKQSGHWANYAENMFDFVVEKETFALKPMNCPGHCLMFAHRVRSYKELPLRLADFGVLHRNEFSGALTGLTRVRRFQQDDAHIFCMPSQITEEIGAVLGFMSHVYGVFGLEFELRLSTRPAKFLGEIAQWDAAEGQLREALQAFGKPWTVNPGDGAFYGPKIDVTVFDALKRRHQCATIQLDFQLPIRFDLSYQGEKGMERPVMIHRAIFGSIERFVAVLTEHLAGKWPFWLSPRQVVLVPVSEHFVAYAKEIHTRLLEEGYWSAVDTSDRTLPKKVREAQMEQYNFILVVGQQELDSRTVNVRTRDNVVHGAKTIDQLLEDFATLVKEKK